MNKYFSKENVEKLNLAQENIGLYTCCGRDIPECLRSKSYKARFDGQDIPYTKENEGILVATEQGWVCPCGKYTQDWFH